MSHEKRKTKHTRKVSVDLGYINNTVVMGLAEVSSHQDKDIRVRVPLNSVEQTLIVLRVGEKKRQGKGREGILSLATSGTLGMMEKGSSTR